jgi:hypothetical protein
LRNLFPGLWWGLLGVFARVMLLFAIAGLAACAANDPAETRSIVTATPSTKYRAIAVFIENSKANDRQAIEQSVIAALNHQGVDAKSSSEIFAAMGTANKQEKADRLQKLFDAVLYVNVMQAGPTEERMENLFYDGQFIVFHTKGFAWASYPSSMGDYIIKPDGSVFKPALGIQLRSDLQDTKTNLQVWSAETIVTGEIPTRNSAGPENSSGMHALFDKAVEQLVEKMRTDNAI